MPEKFFSRRLRTLRDAAKLTQAKLAELAGMSEAGIKQLESGRREPSFETVLTIAAALGVNLADFDPSNEAPEPPPPKKPRPRKPKE